jgi:hypothetical protein
LGLQSRPQVQLTNLAGRNAELNHDEEHRDFQTHGDHRNHRLTVPGFGGPAPLTPVPTGDFALHQPRNSSLSFYVSRSGTNGCILLWNVGCCPNSGGNHGRSTEEVCPSLVQVHRSARPEILQHVLRIRERHARSLVRLRPPRLRDRVNPSGPLVEKSARLETALAAIVYRERA